MLSCQPYKGWVKLSVRLMIATYSRNTALAQLTYSGPKASKAAILKLTALVAVPAHSGREIAARRV